MCRITNLATALVLIALPAFAQNAPEPQPAPPLVRALDTDLQACLVTSVNRLAQVATLQDQIANLQKQLADKDKPAADKPTEKK